MGSRERLRLESGYVSSRRRRWPSCGASVVPRERLPLESHYLQLRRGRGPSRDSEVGAREWLSLGCAGLYGRRIEWPSLGASLGARPRLSLGQPDGPLRRSERPSRRAPVDNRRGMQLGCGRVSRRRRVVQSRRYHPLDRRATSRPQAPALGACVKFVYKSCDVSRFRASGCSTSGRSCRRSASTLRGMKRPTVPENTICGAHWLQHATRQKTTQMPMRAAVISRNIENCCSWTVRHRNDDDDQNESNER